MDGRTQNSVKKGIAFILILLVLLSGYVRVFYGWDWDQSYMVVLASRIAEGNVLFSDLWDLHQTGVLPAAVLYRLYVTLRGSNEGIAVFLRSCTVLAQYICAFAVYKVIKKHYSPDHAFLAAVFTAVFLPRGVTQFEYSTMCIWSALLCSLILLDLWKDDQRTGIHGKVILAGLFYAASVFAYPTMILSVPYYFWLLACRFPAETKIRRKMTVLFFGTCAACVAALFAYLAVNMPVSEILPLFRGILKSGDHPGLFLFLQNPNAVIKSILRTVGLLGAAAVPVLLLRKQIGDWEGYFCVYSVLITVVVIGLNLTGLRKSGPYGLLERYLGLVLIGWFLNRQKTDSTLRTLLYLPGIVFFIGALAGSNLGINENAMYLEMSILSVILSALCGIDPANSKRAVRQTASILILLFGIIFSSVYFVRIDGTSPANITECTTVMETGPIAGVRMKREKKRQLETKGDYIALHTVSGQSYLVAVKDSSVYLYGNGDYDAASYAGTAKFDEQWADYYFEYDHSLPEQIFVDKDLYQPLDAFFELPFGNAVKELYVPAADDNELFYILNRTTQ